MARSQIPDLRKIVSFTLRAIRDKHPSAVTDEDISRIDSSRNVLLVSTRVMLNVLKRSNIISSEDIANIVANSQPNEQNAIESISESVTGIAKETGVFNVWTVMSAVDECLSDLEKSNRCKDWFRLEFYPSVVRRAANGSLPTNREIEIMQYNVSVMRGER